MDLPLVLGLTSAASVSVFLLALALVAIFRGRRRMLGCCCGAAGDLELGGSKASRVADGPDHDEVAATKEEAAVRRFGWAELSSLAGNFTAAKVIGEGGSGTVYLARLPDSSLAALKVHRPSERLHRAFRLELDVLLRLRHPNIVRLLGYCDEREGEGVLVFEYLPKGSLQELLHGSSTLLLPWARRMSILLRLAETLDYLHESCDPQVVHGDVKAANVLLDHQLDPKLCDFGSARVGFSAVVRPPPSRSAAGPMTGSPGYVDPHYLRTGLVSKKSDVYSFGVVALELLTGAEAFCSEEERMLTKAVGPKLRELGEGRVAEMVDSRLGGQYVAEEALAVAEVARLCISEHPTLRPSMAEIVRVMREKVPSALSSPAAR